MAPSSLITKPACRAGLSFRGDEWRAGPWAQVVTVLTVLACAVACADRDGLYARYQLEKKFFEAQQVWSRSQLQTGAGPPSGLGEMRTQFVAVLDEFSAARPTLGPGDSVLFAYAAQAAFRLTDEFVTNGLWHDAAQYQELVAGDSLFPKALRHRALFGWAESYERLGRMPEACALYKRLSASFYPPQAEGGVNVEVLRIPNRLAALAAQFMPESLSAFRAYGESYYESLSGSFPQSDLGFESLGELGKLYGQQGRWDDVMSTLERATDSNGAVLPAYRIDIGEILAGRMHDTAKALSIFKEVAESLPESPFRVDADLKTAAIWFRQGRQSDVQALLLATKRQFLDRSGVQVAVQPLLARSFDAAGNWERARAEFSYLVTTYPRTLQAVEASLVIAERHMQDSEKTAAAEWYSRADRLAVDLISSDESSGQVQSAAMNIRASLAIRMQRWDDAALRLSEIAQTFSSASPVGASALLRLGWLQLRERHDTLAARGAWQAFLLAYPDHPDGVPLKSEMSKWPDKFK